MISKMRLVVLHLLVACSSGNSVDASAGPVTRVVKLLEEMKTQIDKEGAEDDKGYEKYACWCTTNEEEKLAAIKNAEGQISDLTAFLEGAAAREGTLKTEIDELTRDIAEDKDALETATAVRANENQAFLKEEEDMKEIRAALDEAVRILSKVQLLQKHGTGGLSAAESQEATAALVQIRNVVEQRYPQFHSVMQRDLFDVLSSLQDVKLQREGGAFLEQSRLLPWEKTEQQIGKEANPNDLSGQAAGAKSYNSRSGVILGVLSQMHSDFSRDLAAAQTAELQALIQFHQLRAAKLAEIAAGVEQKEQSEAALADLLDKIATSKEDMAALEDAMAADQEFLANLKKNCKSEELEHSSRVNMRTEEIRAISETLKILTDDEARELFGKRQLSFLQLESSERAQDRRAERAMQRLAATARKNGNWALASLAVRVRLDAFTKVREAMDKMIAELRKAQQEEYEKEAYCKKEIYDTKWSIKKGGYTKQDLDEKHRELVNKLEVLGNDVAGLNEEIAEMQVSLKQAGEERLKENVLFQQSVSDQRATVDILQKALARLSLFYSQKDAFVQVNQEPGAAVPPPPPKGKDYQKHGSGGGALQMLSMIINAAGRTEAELETSEQHSQAAYATFAQDVTNSVQANRGIIIEKQRQVASTKAEKSETEEAQLANDQSQEKLQELLAAHHTNCDFVLKYFEVRQKARTEEINSIIDAKAILAGSRAE